MRDIGYEPGRSLQSERGGSPGRHQEWKLLSCSQCQELGQRANLAKTKQVIFQTEAETFRVVVKSRLGSQ